MTKKITPFKLKDAPKTDANLPVSSSVILTELTEKLIGMRKFVAEHYNDVGANGALTVINELERWIKVKVG